MISWKSAGTVPPGYVGSASKHKLDNNNIQQQRKLHRQAKLQTRNKQQHIGRWIEYAKSPT